MNKKEMMDALENYLNEELEDEKADHTLIHYRHVLNELIEYLPDGEIRKSNLIEYKNELMKRYKPSTVNNYLIVINKFIRFVDIGDKYEELSDLKKHKCPLTMKLIKLQEKASLENVLEITDLRRLLRIAKKLGQMDIYYIMKIFAYTGIRAEELKVFTVENVKSNYIQVSNKGKTRNIILRSDLRRELLHYAKENHIQSGTLFPGRYKGKMMHASTIYKRMKKIGGKCRGIDLDKIHPHSFRHLFAVHFIDEGGSLSELMDILGHSSIQTTTIYTRTTDATKKKHLEKMKF